VILEGDELVDVGAQRQYLYFCTSKASKLSTSPDFVVRKRKSYFQQSLDIYIIYI
jgi:hypothetical protein